MSPARAQTPERSIRGRAHSPWGHRASSLIRYWPQKTIDPSMYGDMSRYARGNEKQTISDGIFDDIDSDLTRSARLWKFGCKCCERLVSLNVKNESKFASSFDRTCDTENRWLFKKTKQTKLKKGKKFHFENDTIILLTIFPAFSL